MPRKASPMATAIARHLMCRPQARHDALEILARDRTQGSDHEQSRASADDRERNPIDLAVKCNADHAHTAAANADQTRWTSMRFDMCPRGHTARRSNKNWQNHRGTQAREVQNLRDGPV